LVLYLLLRPVKIEAKVPTERRDVTEFVSYLARYYNPHLSTSDASQIASSVLKWTEARGVNTLSVLAIIAQESAFIPDARGLVGEKGLMQLSDTALDELERVYKIKVDRAKVFDIDYNIELGTLFYLYCVRLAKGNRFEAIARYHMTSHPEYPVAQQYAREVMAKREKISEIYNEFIRK